MGKRAAPTSAAKSPSKASRPEEPSPIMSLIEKARGLTDESATMLKGVAPHCLETLAEDRHAYQKEMVQALSEVVAGVQQDHQAAVASLEKEIADAELGAEAVKARPAELEAIVAERKTARDIQEGLTKAPSDTVAAAKSALTADQSLVKGHDAEVKAAQQELETYSKLLDDAWTRLKAGGFGNSAWRARDNTIKQVMEELEKLNFGASLNSAIPVSLKTKPESRGSFAKTAIDFAEGELRKHIAALTEKVGGAETESARRAEAAAKSDAALAAALKAQEEAFDAFVEAENRLTEAKAQSAGAKKAAAGLEPAARARQAQLGETKKALASVQVLVGQFEELRDRSPPAPADVQGEE